jgi:hypothetical protein
MADVILTGLRRQVLDQIDACDVWLWIAPNGDRVAYRREDPATGAERTCTASVVALITAGLVDPPALLATGAVPELTAAGRALRAGGDSRD